MKKLFCVISDDDDMYVEAGNYGEAEKKFKNYGACPGRAGNKYTTIHKIKLVADKVV